MLEEYRQKLQNLASPLQISFPEKNPRPLQEALNIIIKMPIKPAVVVWMCLLGACRSYKDIGLGIFVSTLLFYLDPKNAAPYVLLTNIYAEVDRWGEVQKIRRLMKIRGIKKMPGCSWIEVHSLVHVFSHETDHTLKQRVSMQSWKSCLV